MEKVVKINLNGKKITANCENKEGVSNAIIVNSGNKVVVNGDGVVDGGEFCAGNKAISIKAGGEVEINGGHFTVGYDKDNDTNSTVYIEGNGAKLTVNGGEFMSIYNDRYTKRPWSYVINISNSVRDYQIELKGGKYYGWNPEDGDDKLGITYNFGIAEGKSWIAEGYEVVKLDEQAEDRGGNLVDVYVVRRKRD